MSHTLRDSLNQQKEEFDLIILDTHPSLDLTFQNVMVAADYYVLPLFAEPESLEGLYVMFKHVKIIKEKLNPTLYILGCLLLNLIKILKHTSAFEEAIRNLGNKIGMPLLR